MTRTTCPLCQTRRCRRACPALGKQICAGCCGTKRLTEIRCPSDCGYLAVARTHPPASIQRQQERDTRFLVPLMKGLTQRQYELFFLIQKLFYQQDQAARLPVNDKIIADTAHALAATYSTASKGIIYEHRPSSLPAEQLAKELRPLIESLDNQRPAATAQDLIVVLQLVERAATQADSSLEGGKKAYLALIGRLSAAFGEEQPESAKPLQQPQSSQRVIIP